MTSSGYFDELFKGFHVEVRVVWSSFSGGGSRRRGPQSVGSAALFRRIRGLEPRPQLGADGSLPRYDRLSPKEATTDHRGVQRGTLRHPQNLRYEFFAGRLTSQVGHCSSRNFDKTTIFCSLLLRLPLSARSIRLRRWTHVAIPKADDPSKRQPLIRVRGAALI